MYCRSVIFTTVGQNQLILNADLGKEKINKHIYGHFAEHLGRCIYGGFYVGESNTKIKHTNGVRNDVVDASEKIKNTQPSLARWLFCRYVSLERWYRAKR